MILYLFDNHETPWNIRILKGFPLRFAVKLGL
jgi:hypothetical protein